MKIDFEATRHNMRLIRPSRYAKEHGFPEPTLRRVLKGDYGNMGPAALAVVDALRVDGFLVEVPEDDSNMPS